MPCLRPDRGLTVHALGNLPHPARLPPSYPRRTAPNADRLPYRTDEGPFTTRGSRRNRPVSYESPQPGPSVTMASSGNELR
jgi:hypothetical protein